MKREEEDEAIAVDPVASSHSDEPTDLSVGGGREREERDRERQERERYYRYSQNTVKCVPFFGTYFYCQHN